MTPPAATAGICEVDPAIVAVERARACFAAFSTVVSRQSRLEQALPKNLRASDNWAGEMTIVETDDPAWIAVLREIRAISDALDIALLDLLETQNHPTTLPGVAAVLRFCADGHHNGAPDFCLYDESTGTTAGWEETIMRMCADVMVRLASCQS
jgi:hypothetical protein